MKVIIKCYQSESKKLERQATMEWCYLNSSNIPLRKVGIIIQTYIRIPIKWLLMPFLPLFFAPFPLSPSHNALHTHSSWPSQGNMLIWEAIIYAVTDFKLYLYILYPAMFNGVSNVWNRHYFSLYILGS